MGGHFKWGRSFFRSRYRGLGQPLRPAFEVSQQIWGRRPNPPAISVMFVAGLANPEFLVEMDAIAVVVE